MTIKMILLTQDQPSKSFIDRINDIRIEKQEFSEHC